MHTWVFLGYYDYDMLLSGRHECVNVYRKLTDFGEKLNLGKEIENLILFILKF